MLFLRQPLSITYSEREVTPDSARAIPDDYNHQCHLSYIVLEQTVCEIYNTITIMHAYR